MNRYIKTNMEYLYVCAVFIFLQCGLIPFSDERMRKPQIIFLAIYIVLVSICVVKTIGERRKMQNIIRNGRHQRGIVSKLYQLNQEHSISRFGNKLTKTVYRIQAEVQDEFGGRTVYCSDLLSPRKIHHIPKELDIYYDSGQCCILWEKTSNKVVHHVEELKETEEGDICRILLSFLNGLLGIGMVLFAIAILYLASNKLDK